MPIASSPVVAAEVAGQDEDESVLRLKARWYLDRGVRIAARPELPDLSPDMDRLFAQLG